MRLIGRDMLRQLMDRENREHPQDARALRKAVGLWSAVVEAATWRNSMDVKRAYGSADQVGNNRMVFDICGNKYRLVAKINYLAGVVEVRFADRHGAYNAICDITNL